MEVIYGGRRCGKTSKLIEYMRDNPECHLLTFSHYRVMELGKQYPDLKGRFMSLVTFNSRKHTELVIDDLDLVLNRIFVKLPRMVSFTPTFCSKPIHLAPNKEMLEKYGPDAAENQELF